MGYDTYHDMLEQAQQEAEQEAAFSKAQPERENASSVSEGFSPNPEVMLAIVDRIEKDIRELLNSDAIMTHKNQITGLAYIHEKSALIARLAALRAYREGVSQVVKDFTDNGLMHALLTREEADILVSMRKGNATKKQEVSIKIDTTPMREGIERIRLAVEQAREQHQSDESLDTSGAVVDYLRRQWEWSLRTFGPGFRTEGVLAHIRKELGEVEKEPHDLMEWIDIVILALDGFWRHGGSPERVMMLLQKKQDKNFARNWPDWRERSEDQAIEHDRSAEMATATS